MVGRPDEPVAAESTTGYPVAEETPQVDFGYRFDADTEVTGTPLLTEWVLLDARRRRLWSDSRR